MSTKSKSIQEKMNDLAEQIAWFDSDDFSLEAAIERFKQAEKLASEIEGELTEERHHRT